MIDLYWITRLDMISNWITAFAVISGFFLIINIIAYLMCHHEYVDNIESSHPSYKIWNDFWANKFKIAVPMFIICLIFSILTPTTKEGFMIYGVGSTIDYIRKDSTAINIPHKAIEALDGWVETLQKDSNVKK